MSEEYSGLGRRGERERGGAEGKKKKEDIPPWKVKVSELGM